MAFVDYDSSDALKLVNHAAEMARSVQDKRNEICTRMDMLYHGVPKTIRRDPRRYNHFMPKPFTSVETLVPRYIRANHGTRPFIPIEAKNKDEFGYLADLHSELYDHYLDKAGFLEARILQTKIAVVQGTAFMNTLPDFEDVEERYVDWSSGQPVVTTRNAKRFRLLVETWAPWEVLFHPRATGLARKGQCKYAIKIGLTSRRALKKLYEANPDNYPGIDVEALYRRQSGASTELTKHYGLRMLRGLGLPEPMTDEDDEVYLRYESEERYIDILGGDVLIRNIEHNPMPHGLINLSKQIHTIKPHTQDCFWGYGALKPVEAMFNLRNDMINNALDAAAAQTQFRIYHDADQDPNQFTTIPNARIKIKRKEGSALTDHFYESKGGSLDKEFYTLPNIIDKETERAQGVYDVTAGDAPSRSSTATQDMLRDKNGDIRLEMGVVHDEIFLRDMMGKTVDIVGSNITIADVAEVLGVEKAMQMYQQTPNGMELASHPKKIPGGFDYALKGKDKIGQEFIKQQVAKETAQTIMGFPTTIPDEFEKVYMERAGYTKDEIARCVRSEEDMMKIRMGMQGQEREMIEGAA